MSETIPTPKDLFGFRRLTPAEGCGLTQSLSDYIMHVTRVVIENPAEESQVLLAQRTNGEWHVPGGQGELLQTCSSTGEDEIKQELGLEISLKEAAGKIFEMRFMENGKGPDKHAGKLRVGTVFTVRTYQGEITPLDQTIATAWSTPTAIDQLGVVRPDTYPALMATGHL